jgi:hypothetical protein
MICHCMFLLLFSNFLAAWVPIRDLAVRNGLGEPSSIPCTVGAAGPAPGAATDTSSGFKLARVYHDRLGWPLFVFRRPRRS